MVLVESSLAFPATSVVFPDVSVAELFSHIKLSSLILSVEITSTEFKSVAIKSTSILSTVFSALTAEIDKTVNKIIVIKKIFLNFIIITN